MENKILLKNTKEAEEFVNEVSKCPFAIDLQSGSVYIDAKSLLGVLTMGVKREMNILCAEEDATLRKLVKKYAVA